MEKLAINGGTPVKTAPFGTGGRFGAEELEQLREALEQQTLFYWSGKKVRAFCDRLAGIYGVKRCVAVSSGTASIHTALGAIGLTEGDEVIVPPITDIGTVAGVLYQNAIPVFADLDPHTYNLDPGSVEGRITDKTKAVVAVHLAGNPSDMDALSDVAKRRGLYLIEDCAQAWMSYYKGRLTGTIGHMGCFSTNDYKHISTGDGGAVLTDDEALYERAFKFADKNYDRLNEGPAKRECESLAPNYRMNELAGAVGLAQLGKLEAICARRSVIGERITGGIKGLPGVYPPKVYEGCRSSCWFYMMRINEGEAGAYAGDFAKALAAEGIPASCGYIGRCIYEYPIFRDKNAYPGTKSPFDKTDYGREVSYGKGLCPVAEQILDSCVSVAVSEFYTDRDADDIIRAIAKVSAHYGARA